MSYMDDNGWQPNTDCQQLSVTSSSQRVAIPNNSGTNWNPPKLRLATSGTTGASVVYVRFGDVTVTATSADDPLPASYPYVEIMRAPKDATHMAYIADTGTCKLNIGSGNGD